MYNLIKVRDTSNILAFFIQFLVVLVLVMNDYFILAVQENPDDESLADPNGNKRNIGLHINVKVSNSEEALK